MAIGAVNISQQQIEAFCRKWKVKEFALFGSVLRQDLGQGSDVDVLVEMLPESELGWDVVDMQNELRELFGREVDLVFKEGLKNPYRRAEILNTRRILYAAA